MSFDIAQFVARRDMGEAKGAMVSNSETIEEPAATSPAKRVLLVENDFLIAMTIAEQLDELGYAVVGPAYALAEGCQLAADAPIDAALIDCGGCAERDTGPEQTPGSTRRDVDASEQRGLRHSRR
jgi:hypothetical protein